MSELEKEATEEQRTKAARLGAVVGTRTYITKIVKNVKEGLQDKGSRYLIKRGQRIFASAGEEDYKNLAQLLPKLGEQAYTTRARRSRNKRTCVIQAGVGGFVQALTDMIAPRRGGRRDVTETEGSGEGAPVDTQGEQGTRDLPIPQELQKLEPLDWILLTQLLDLTMWEKDQKTIH